ncbi:MAG: class I SAM-dependent methyltransferase [Hormoscilla sp. GM7CHS1pb]|nr:class I SAM-dependent methyltransferase [Hormoscilla sp. GM7CHS1pb]
MTTNEIKLGKSEKKMKLSKSEYNKSSYFYDEIMNEFKMYFSLYEDLVEILKPKSVLELGCGMGRLFWIFMKEAKEITGIDLSDEMISQGRKYYAEHKVENAIVEFVNTDMCSFQLNKKYDLIVFALSVLKHLSTDKERLAALKKAKEHLSEEGFIVIDQAPLLYASRPTDWIDAKNSLVADWLPDPSVLDGYQWKKSLKGNIDILQWRYENSEEIQFEVQFTTYRYDIDRLIEHLSQLDMSHEQMLTEWGVNGLGNKGKRFIGFACYPGKKYSPKRELIENVKKRNERLWSDFDLYIEDKKSMKM